MDSLSRHFQMIYRCTRIEWEGRSDEPNQRSEIRDPGSDFSPEKRIGGQFALGSLDI